MRRAWRAWPGLGACAHTHTHSRAREHTQTGRPSFLQGTTLHSHNYTHTTQHGTSVYGHNSTPHNSKRPQLDRAQLNTPQLNTPQFDTSQLDTTQLYTATTRHSTTLHRLHGRMVVNVITLRQKSRNTNDTFVRTVRYSIVASSIRPCGLCRVVACRDVAV